MYYIRVVKMPNKSRIALFKIIDNYIMSDILMNNTIEIHFVISHIHNLTGEKIVFLYRAKDHCKISYDQNTNYVLLINKGVMKNKMVKEDRDISAKRILNKQKMLVILLNYYIREKIIIDLLLKSWII